MKTDRITILLVVVAVIAVIAMFVIPNSNDITEQIRVELDCQTKWTDLTGSSHCDCRVDSLGERVDSSGVITMTVWHCADDSVKFGLAPRGTGYRRAK